METPSERQLWNQLREQRELLGNAIEELLRFISPILWVTRVMTEDVETRRPSPAKRQQDTSRGPGQPITTRLNSKTPKPWI